MTWEGRLRLHYRCEGARTVAHDTHEGPLRVLRSLYPEGPGVCHHVLVHPPGGIVGGDHLSLAVDVDAGAHALITTPGATRFYRSAGVLASQTATLRLAAGARLEWLPLETLAYSGCQAENRLNFELVAGAEMMGWEVLALGLPAAHLPFDSGTYLQELTWPGRWLERGRIDATDHLLLDSPLGLAGQRVIATLWFAATPHLQERRDALLESARELLAGTDPYLDAGATSPHADLVVLRVLTSRVEPAMQLLRAVRGRWRELAWQLPPSEPRVWQT